MQYSVAKNMSRGEWLEVTDYPASWIENSAKAKEQFEKYGPCSVIVPVPASITGPSSQPAIQVWYRFAPSAQTAITQLHGMKGGGDTVLSVRRLPRASVPPILLPSAPSEGQKNDSNVVHLNDGPENPVSSSGPMPAHYPSRAHLNHHHRHHHRLTDTRCMQQILILRWIYPALYRLIHWG
jgi:hypothetical protein